MLLPRPEPHAMHPTMLPLFLHAPLKNEDLQPLVIRVPKRLAASRSWSRRPRRRASSPSESQARAKETSLVVDVDLDGKRRRRWGGAISTAKLVVELTTLSSTPSVMPAGAQRLVKVLPRTMTK